VAYQLTEQTLSQLKDKKVEENVITLLEKLLNQDFDKEEVFINAVKECIGESKTNQYKKDIVNVARKTYAVLRNKSTRQALINWWQDLEEIKLPNGKTKSNRGERAKLRRCEKPEDILLQSSFYELQQQFPKTPVLALAAVAGLLAHIKKPSEFSFPKQLGQQKEQSGKAVFSELRFQQLLASRDIDELYENLRRAIIQLNRTANILSLADGVLHWEQEQRNKNQFDERPEQRFQFTWAKAYFSEVLTYSK
jgi:CRISPR system Cascade subunit CasB